MTLLDTDVFSELLAANPRMAARFRATTDAVAITLITRIEALDGRFAFLLKAANGEQLLRAQEWLRRTEGDRHRFTVIPLDAAAAAQFDQLREHKNSRELVGPIC